ncbi:hypothetical protein O6H91_21G028800 [Diphasiastrum complanatum]|uniref:Uncharacterized protein n=1 Tax=Diphasiastrum complanatum TaxID=34168 RepID=A0ACC2AJD5_DIPCM|nr:hypothetical protein O6H91_21G028800 [Diphasiastrum complanatum]
MIRIICKSQNDDLGVNYLKPSDSREWQFNGWPWTVFSCDFEWNTKHMHQATWTFNFAFFVCIGLGVAALSLSL